MTTTTARADTMRAADRLLLRAAGRVPGRLAAATVTSVAGAAVSLLVPATLATATDAVLAGRGVGTAGVTLVALLVVGAAADMLGGLASAGCVAGTTAWLRHRLVGHILAVGVSGVGAGGGSGRFAAGDLTSRLVGNSTEAAQVLPAAVRTAISFATSIGGVVALWLIDVRLAVALLFGVPVVVILIRLFTIQAADLFLRYQRIQGAIAGRLTDALAGARTIRAAGTTDREIARVLQPLPELAATGRATWGTQRQLVWRASLLLPVIEISVLAVAGYGVVAGRIAPGQLLAAAGYVALALSVLDQLD